ncbi:MAG TPA: VOC family protein [Cryptosporangiaceae bacterium]|nr:VOC family protein [Cryptosporangiaceae bacterium]
MTDPWNALRTPVEPIEPDPAFAARLRDRLRRAVLDTPGGAMTETTTRAQTDEPEDLAWPPSLSPYIAVPDARRALDWYAEVFGATRRGEPHVMPDGRIGHAELRLGDAVLMLADGSEDVPFQPPTSRVFSHTLHLQVDDVDATVRRAEDAGAEIERRPQSEPYGRVAVLVDPFGHRWMLNKPPGTASRARHGEVVYTSMLVPDDELAREFYGAVLGWQFAPGSVERGWLVRGQEDRFGLAGGGERPEVQLCYRVNDVETAADRVREQGGQAGSVDLKPYGLLVDCVDNQGVHFQLWQPSP